MHQKIAYKNLKNSCMPIDNYFVNMYIEQSFQNIFFKLLLLKKLKKAIAPSNKAAQKTTKTNIYNTKTFFFALHLQLKNI